MSTYDKMYSSNSKARKWLTERGFIQIQMFPHTRWNKDIHIGNLSFDGIARDDLCIILFQVKSNQRPTKKTQQEMSLLTEQYKRAVRFVWINCPDRKEVEVFGL